MMRIYARAAVIAVMVATMAACSDSESSKTNTADTDTDSGAAPSAKMSASYSNLCATCHGPEGRGANGNPSIPGARDESGFITRVREGNGRMPPFDASLITDAELKADYRWLTTERQ
jgi:mono/diheme cytochrome c family protein